ncbi:MAG: hypothetical protein V1799_07355 [bacterium]
MKSSTADHARDIWEELRNGIFTEQHLILVVAERLKYISVRDSTYFDLRNTATGKVLEVIEYICTPNLEIGKMNEFVLSQSIPVQSFLLDRFLYVDEYLNRLDKKEFFLSDPESFLRWGLIDLWDSRPRIGEWI